MGRVRQNLLTGYDRGSYYTYTGSAIKLGVTVKYDGKTLTNGTDYTLSYSNNTNAGTATVTVKGKGSYEGTVSKTFRITVDKVSMYRLYNRYTGEHLYTASSNERYALQRAGWSYEGIGWSAPSKSNKPVYRLYNLYVKGGDHHYTTDKNEYGSLQKQGWKAEGIGWYGVK